MASLIVVNICLGETVAAANNVYKLRSNTNILSRYYHMLIFLLSQKFFFKLMKIFFKS